MVAVGLYVLLTRTRIGTAMRASVDNPELLRLFGGKPDQVAALAWMIGISLAGLGGILLVSTVGLDYFALTLLVINAYAAAMLGRLKSLPLTFVGAMVLGLLTSYVAGYVPPRRVLSARSRTSSRRCSCSSWSWRCRRPSCGSARSRASSRRRCRRCRGRWAGAPGCCCCVALLAGSLSEPNLLLVGTAATFAIVMLSLVLLTGYGGHVSLAQLTFAGRRRAGLRQARRAEPLRAAASRRSIAAGVGALVALPVLRLTGLYLALATLAFASIMDKMVFQAEFAFGFNGTLAGRAALDAGPHRSSSTGGYVFVMAVFLVVVAWALLLLRRGVVGRMLIAMRDSPAACGTLGLDMRWFRVGLFALSAGMAGLAGALFAGLRQNIGAADFIYFNSLLLLLLRRGRSGVTSVTGAALGGIGADAAARAPAELPVDGRPALRGHRGRRDPAGRRPQRPGRSTCSGSAAGSSARSRRRIRANLPTLPRRLAATNRRRRVETRPSASRPRHTREVPAHAH